MPQPSDLTQLSREELTKLVAAVEEELEDVAAERALTLGGTGVHISAKEVERLRAEFERDERRLNERLAEINAHIVGERVVGS
jgi:hypothetical protein